MKNRETEKGNQYFFVKANPLYGQNVREARPMEFPFVVVVARINRHNTPTDNVICTGSLITRKDVLSAQHCVRGRRIETTEIIYGNFDLTRGIKMKVLGWINFETWATEKNPRLLILPQDITVIKLKDKVSSNIQLANLSNRTCIDSWGLKVIAAGYGGLIGGVDPTTLHAVNLTVLTNHQCSRVISTIQKTHVGIEMDLFCTTTLPFALIICGDSGGPLMYDKTIIGINKSTCPFPGETVNPRKVNMHVCIYNYRNYIEDAINKKLE